MRFRVELRSRWRDWLTLAVVTGLAGGVLIATAAGARRTDTALARYLVAYRFRDASVFANDPFYLGKVKKLPQVEASSLVATIGFGGGPSILGPHAMAIYASTDGQEGVALDRWKLLAGKRPDQSHVRDALLDSRAAHTFGVVPGDRLAAFTFGATRVPLRVVGVVASTDPINHPSGVVYLTKAFYGKYTTSAFEYNLNVRLKRGVVELPAFQRGVERIQRIVGAPGGALSESQVFNTREIQSSIHPLVQALWLGVALGALLSFLLLAQSLARLSASAAPQYRTLRALGTTNRQLVGLGVARTATIAAAAAALAVGTGVALSPLAPVGYARQLEPHPGLAVDSLAVGLGGLAVIGAVLLAGSLAAWRASREAVGVVGGTGRVQTADALARFGMPAPITTGVRLALARGRSPISGRASSALVGSILAVTVTATALTFSASLHHLFTTPRLFGQNWDFRVDAPPLPPPRFEHDPSISAVAYGDDKGLIQVNGRQVGVRAMEDLKGSLPPTVIEGLAPTRPDEILLGTKTMQALGVQIGDSVHVCSARCAPMRIVGRGVLPTGAYLVNELGEGAAMAWDAYARVSNRNPQVLELRIAPDANRAQTLSKLKRQFPEPVPGLPGPAVDFGGVKHLPAMIAALLVALAVVALAQALVAAVQRRRRDLAILKTLGFDRRQVLGTVASQATTFVAVGLLIGLPVGDALGRWAWNLFADQLGVVPEAVTPVPLLLLVVPAAIVLANLVAVIPAQMAARTRPAFVLRAE
jgi:hypothetical protein